MFYLSKNWKKDLLALFLLLLAVTLLYLPVMAGRRGIFHDDQAMAEFPWHYFLARHFQKGEIPRWEPHTWCGAIPFCARYYADTYYLPLWPLYLIARLDDLDLAYWYLSLIPLLLHYGLAAAGMYVFARRSIRMRPGGAVVCAWVYLFSPALAYSYVWFPIVVVQAWLPWLLNLVVALDRKPTGGKVVATGVIFALMTTAAQPPHLGYSLLLSLIVVMGLSFRRWRRGQRVKAARLPLLLILAGLLSVILSAVYWLPALDGLSHTGQNIPLSYQEVAGEDGSLPPLYLVTLLVPHLFGTVTGHHMWGADISYEARYWEANMSGGVLLMFLALAGVALIVRSRSGCRRLRFWAGLGAGVWGLALLCSLGRHTPFYYLLFRYVPILSSFPYPIRFRLLQCVATAWLAGIGYEHARAHFRFESPWPAKSMWAFLGIAAIAVSLGLIWPQDLTRDLLGYSKSAASAWAFPGVREIFIRGEGGWFLSGPVLYLLGSSAALILIWRGLVGKARALAVAFVVMIESAAFGASAFYYCTFERRYPRPEHYRASRPSAHPLIRRVLGPLAAGRPRAAWRWATDQPFHDNFARLDGSFALMGYDMKPLEKRFKRAIEEAYQIPMDWPIYWDYPRAVHLPFLNHMSVKALMDTDPASPFSEGGSRKLEVTPELFLHDNPEALPRVFVMDRVVEATADEQLDELVRGELRAAVFMEKAPPGAVPEGVMTFRKYRKSSSEESGMGRGGIVPGEEKAPRSPAAGLRVSESVARFYNLQEMNPVGDADFDYANRIAAVVEVGQPLMLVFTEVWYPGWKAYVDGKPVPLYRVNYCQRGLWLNRGKHRVLLRFQPIAWKTGAEISLVGWLGVLGWGAVCWRKGRRSE